MGRRGAVLVLMLANPVTVTPAPAQLVGEPVGGQLLVDNARQRGGQHNQHHLRHAA